jgi:hypothetical protein
MAVRQDSVNAVLPELRWSDHPAQAPAMFGPTAFGSHPIMDTGAANTAWCANTAAETTGNPNRSLLVATRPYRAGTAGSAFRSPIFSIVVCAARDKLIAGINPNPRPAAETIPVSFS